MADRHGHFEVGISDSRWVCGEIVSTRYEQSVSVVVFIFRKARFFRRNAGFREFYKNNSNTFGSVSITDADPRVYIIIAAAYVRFSRYFVGTNERRNVHRHVRPVVPIYSVYYIIRHVRKNGVIVISETRIYFSFETRANEKRVGVSY